jgi:hypothetical protein
MYAMTESDPGVQHVRSMGTYTIPACDELIAIIVRDSQHISLNLKNIDTLVSS